MRNLIMICSSAALLTVAVFAADSTERRADIYPQLRTYLQTRAAEFDRIPAERKTELQKIALYVKNRATAKQPARLTFICTHNSRRSHMSQIWATTAAQFYDVPGVQTFSGGTEATAFNPRAVAAIQRSGVKVDKVQDGKNPRYEVRAKDAGIALVCFSKAYSDAANPKEDFCAIMTCSQADKNCPNIDGCSLRVAIPYEDPKVSDDKPEEQSTYDERRQQICREMLYLFSQVGN